jgi:hypothetical protein
MKKLTLFLLLLPLFALQCKKDKDTCPDGDKACELAKLPPLTTEGKGTFGCLVNGKAWLAESSTLIPSIRSIYYDEEDAYFIESIKESEEMSSLLSFNIVKFNLYAKQYNLNVYVKDTTSEGTYLYCWDNDGCNRISYYTNENQTGFFNVQYVDSASQIISGTFNFNAQASNGETVCVTDGRFDMWFEVQ